MAKDTRLATLVTVALLLLGGCAPSESTSGSAPSEPAATPATSSAEGAEECTPLTKSELDQIADGLKDSKIQLTEGARLPLPDDLVTLGLKQVAAVSMSKGEPATFAIGEELGPIVAVNESAQKSFTWGEAATDGSPMGDARDAVGASEQATKVVDCLG